MFLSHMFLSHMFLSHMFLSHTFLSQTFLSRILPSQDAKDGAVDAGVRALNRQRNAEASTKTRLLRVIVDPKAVTNTPLPGANRAMLRQVLLLLLSLLLLSLLLLLLLLLLNTRYCWVLGCCVYVVHHMWSDFA